MRILLIGLPASGRLESVQRALSNEGVEGDFDAAHSISAVRASNSGGVPAADVILVFQDWPEQYPIDDVNWLLSNHPATRILCVYGAFCEADGRTRGIWPDAVRVAQWGLRSRLRRELSVRVDDPPHRLPLTASRRERFLFQHGPCRESRVEFRSIGQRAIRIVSPDSALEEALAGLLDVTRQPQTPPDVILVDVDPWGAESRQRLTGLVRHYPGARLIALAGFPAHVPVRDIIDSGAERVLPKILTADELVDAIR